jgi:hypothetical protein
MLFLQPLEIHLQSPGYRVDTLDRAATAPQKRSAWNSHADEPSHDAVCCSAGCQGPVCARLRSIVQDLVTEICTRDPHVSGVIPSSDYLPPKPVSDKVLLLMWL